MILLWEERPREEGGLCGLCDGGLVLLDLTHDLGKSV